MLVFHIQWVSDNNPLKIIKKVIIIFIKVFRRSTAVNGHLIGTLNSSLKFISFSS